MCFSQMAWALTEASTHVRARPGALMCLGDKETRTLSGSQYEETEGRGDGQLPEEPEVAIGSRFDLSHA